MKQPKPGEHLIVRQGVHEYDATVIGIAVKIGAVICRVEKPEGTESMIFDQRGRGDKGARLQKTRTVGVRVAGAVE